MGDCNGPDDGLYQLQQSYIQDVFNRQVLDSHSTHYATIAGQGDTVGGNQLLDGEDDGSVTVASVRYLRPDLPEDPNPDHPGLHRTLYPAYERGHSALIQQGSEALPRSLCTVYPQQYLCPSDIVELPPLSPSAGSTATGESVELAANGSVVVPAGENVNLTLEVEPSPLAVIVVLTGNTTVTGTWNGNPMQATDVFGMPALTLDAVGGTGILELDNNGSEDAPTVALAAVQTSRVMTVTPAQGLARAGTATSAMLTLTASSPSEQVHFQVTNDGGSLVATGLATHTSGETWSAPFTPAAAGTYTVAAWTEEQAPRSGHAVVPVAASDGHQIETTVVIDTGVDDNGDGAFEALNVSVPVTSPTGGTYRLAARLRGSAGEPVTTTGAVATLPVGTTPIMLRFAGQDIFRSGVDGPYTVADVVLSDADDLTILDEAATLATTATYQSGDFEHDPVEIDEHAFSDTAEDTTGDGLFDRLLVTGQVRVDAAGTYAINARLLADNGAELVEAQQTTTLSASSNTFTLDFDWDGIRAAGIDGPYVVADLSIYPTFDTDGLGFLTTAHTTAAYASGIQPAGFGTVTGTVLCSPFGGPTSHPVDNAEVSVAGLTATTNAKGKFRIDEVPAGVHTLTAAPPESSPCVMGSMVVTVEPDDVTTATIRLAGGDTS
jgi:hypothetical protein